MRAESEYGTFGCDNHDAAVTGHSMAAGPLYTGAVGGGSKRAKGKCKVKCHVAVRKVRIIAEFLNIHII